MTKKQRPGNLPDWYWARGLHDACITACAPIGEDGLSLKIDASGALFERDIREIRFYHFSIVKGSRRWLESDGVYWLSDRLTRRTGEFVLEINVWIRDLTPQKKTIVIQFSHAEVISL